MGFRFDPMATNRAKDLEDMAQMNYFAPYIQQVKAQEAAQSPSAAAAQSQTPSVQQAPAESAPMSDKSQKMWGDVGGSAITGLATVLAGIGAQQAKRESEELKAQARAKSNVLAAEQNLKTNTLQRKSDMIKRLVDTAALIRR
jgi:hypothetical protein